MRIFIILPLFIVCMQLASYNLIMTLNSLLCADVPLRNNLFAHSGGQNQTHITCPIIVTHMIQCIVYDNHRVELRCSESFGSLLKNYNASAFATPMKIPTVEQIIQTLPPTITDHGSTTVTSHTNVSVCATFCVKPSTDSILNTGTLLTCIDYHEL